jgi:hypothetical protein
MARVLRFYTPRSIGQSERCFDGQGFALLTLPSALNLESCQKTIPLKVEDGWLCHFDFVDLGGGFLTELYK